MEPDLTRKERKDLDILALFTAVYCRVHHDGEKSLLDLAPAVSGFRKRRLCAECHDFLRYAIDRRLKCPLDPKPTCKHCHIHCYRAGHRERVREIMRFSGRHLILRGRLDLLLHFLF